MLTISTYSVEFIKDPFGIIEGKRYEYLLDLDIPDDDELYSELGVYVRVIYRHSEDRPGIVKYEIRERSTDRYLDFDLEEEELKEIEAFCKEHLAEADQ